MLTKIKLQMAFAIGSLILFAAMGLAQGQPERPGRGATAKPITVPVTIHIRESKPKVEMRFADYLLREDGDIQTPLSVRSGEDSPMWLAILIQDDLVSSTANEMKGLGEFIRRLPDGSHVMVGYMRSGTLDIRRKFTTDLERAAKGLRAPLGLATAGPYNPYVEIIEALRKYDSQPLGRRAVIVVSDGVDVSRGVDSSAPSQSLDLQRSITEAQRRSVAIYSIYAPSAANSTFPLSANGQSCLERLSNETGGRAFFQGIGAAVSFDPFLKEIDESLARQIALTYLSTHTAKGFHRLDIKPLDRDVEIRHPSGYTR